jgi:hypothetical protein
MLQMRQDITAKNTNIAAMNTRQGAKSTPRAAVENIMKRAAGVCVCVCVCVRERERERERESIMFAQ